ncbi:quinoprotein relay system zinc metallohydrolase 2 [uncultured Aquincola sp.]|uniref:quinoprotein relay system zinc metallohydrolase 2 n=1 Tax=uncultured Aquincola sp. TaxID=886556 RepID=UPI0032B131EA|tara:strand:- start:644 stop:1657 length:1014 start_codon:yes stop_codon:yes gene_type:complete
MHALARTAASQARWWAGAGMAARWWAGLLLAVGVQAVGMPAMAANAEVAPLAMTQTAPGVWVHTGAVDDWQPRNGGDVANLGFVVGSRCVAVIDTGGTPALGQALRRAVAQATPLPVCWVINTHMHPDHVLGNAAFRDQGQADAPRFVGHARLAASLAAREPYYRQALQREFGIGMPAADIVPPSVPVEGRLTLDLGDRELQLQAWPTAHTDNDLTVYDVRSRTLFLGDLLFVQHLPVVDGSLTGWLKVMDTLATLDVALAVPGHGAAGTDWPGMLAPQRRYLQALRTDTRAAIRAGLPLSKAMTTVGLEAVGPWRLAETFHRRNVTAAYAELEWEE